MNSLLPTSHQGLCCIGETALNILSNSQEGSVLVNMTHATYLMSSEGELFWLIPKDGPMHQRGMAVSSAIPRCVAGSRYEITNQILATSSGELLNFQNPSLWIPPTISSADVVSSARLAKSIHALVNQIMANYSPSGFGALITPILQVVTQKNLNLKDNYPNSLLEKAWQAIREMIQAYLICDTRHVIDVAKSLVGFGEGLTPSGDDFLGGFFFSCRLLDKYYKKSFTLPICTYLDFIHDVKPLTNRISYTILKDHAEGHSVEPLQLLSNGLLIGKSVDQLIPHATKLISIGHSTGWDLLTGFLAGISAIFKPSD